MARKETKQVGVRLSPSEYKRLNRIARASGVSMNALGCLAINSFCKNPKTVGDTLANAVRDGQT